jgi:hypothetical protein
VELRDAERLEEPFPAKISRLSSGCDAGKGKKDDRFAGLLGR